MTQSNSFFARAGAPDAAPPWSPSSALLTVGFALVALIAGASIVYIWAGDQSFTELAGWTLGGVLASVFVWQTRRRQWDALRLHAARTPLVFVMFIALGFAIGLDLLSLAVTGAFVPKPELLALAPGALSAADLIFAVAFMVIVQPISEGLVFRGVALPAVRQVAGAWGGMAITAALTGAFHMLVFPPNYNTTAPITPLWYGLIVPIIEAIIFSMVRGYTGSTRAAIAAHVAFGVFAVIKLLAVG